MNFIKQHIEALLAVVLCAVVVLGLVAYQQEHDARIRAEAVVGVSESRVTQLEQNVKQIQTRGTAQIVALQKQATKVTTAPQAIQAIPVLTDKPLNLRTVPELPNAVTVDAVPLFQQLNECKQTAVGLGMCKATVDEGKKIIAEKDLQITALKKKPGFWNRAKNIAIQVGVGVAVGYAIHR